MENKSCKEHVLEWKLTVGMTDLVVLYDIWVREGL